MDDRSLKIHFLVLCMMKDICLSLDIFDGYLFLTPPCGCTRRNKMAASESTKMPKLNGSHLEFEQEMKSNRFILFYYESALS